MKKSRRLLVFSSAPTVESHRRSQINIILDTSTVEYDRNCPPKKPPPLDLRRLDCCTAPDWGEFAISDGRHQRPVREEKPGRHKRARCYGVDPDVLIRRMARLIRVLVPPTPSFGLLTGKASSQETGGETLSRAIPFAHATFPHSDPTDISERARIVQICGGPVH